MNRLKQLRKEKNMSQEELAKKLHLKRSAISKYETGTISLSDSLIMELTELFDVSSDYLLCKTDIPNSAKMAILTDGVEFAFLEGYRQLSDADREVINQMADHLLEIRRSKIEGNE